ncbi:hypothetical protein DVK02_14870 [Halobellus sp. Atlit-31R]|nr:hypothetical protein DVK02_14870 [Halobellus sp. Atlit-31R]
MPKCNVDGCEKDAVGTICGEDGFDTAYRCIDCLCTDLDLRKLPDRDTGDVQEGISYAKSPATGCYYRVTRWVDHGDGKIEARQKHEVDREEVPQHWLDVLEDEGGVEA